MSRRFFEYLPVLLISLLAAYPIVNNGIPDFVDSANHFYRVVALDWHIQHFDFYPRWFADLHYGFGAPVFNFYAPLSYYFVILFRLFGLSLPLCYALGYVVAFVLAAFGVYQWARELDYAPLASLVAAAGYVITPHFYMNTIHRGVYPETVGIAITPWLFWAALRLTRNTTRTSQITFTLIYTALILTHNLIAFIITPPIIFYLIANIAISKQSSIIKDARHRTRNALKLLIIYGSLFILAIALAAFYLIPVILESNTVYLTRVLAQNFSQHFASISELFWLPTHYDPQRLSNPHNHAFAIPQLLIACSGILIISLSVVRRRLSLNNFQSTIFLLHLTLLIIFTYLALPTSQPVWEAIPIASFIQNPRRLLGPAALFLAMLVGGGTDALINIFPKKIRGNSQTLIASIFVSSFFIFTLPWTYHRPYDPYPSSPLPLSIIQHEIKTGLIGTTGNGEFVPRTVTEFPSPELLLQRYAADSVPSRLAAPPEGVKCQVLNVKLNEEEVKCESPKEFTLNFYRFYFPGWAATLDTNPITIYPSQPNGNISLTVPAGQHTIKVFLQPTTPQIVGTIISLIALIILIALSRLPFTSYPLLTIQQPTSNIQYLFCSLLIVSLFIFRITYLDQNETIFRYTQINSLPNPASINFGDQLELIGNSSIPNSISAEDSLEVMLYWKSIPPIADNYSVSIQLADRFGNRFGQSDSQHPDQVPTSVWRDAQYAQDEHRLAIQSGTPPGEYHLLVSVYSATKRLNVMRDGSPAEIEFDLGVINLKRSPAQPASDLRLVDYSLATRNLTVGDSLAFTTLWHSGDKPTNGLTATVTFTDSGNNLLFAKDFAPSGIDYTPDKWSRNELIRYPQTIIVPPDLNAGTYRVGITVNNGAQFDLGEVKIAVPTRAFIIPKMGTRLDYDFNESIRLLGYDVTDEAITLYWQPKKFVEKKLTVFVHKLENGVVVSGHDANPIRPTTSWVKDEVIADVHPIRVGNSFEIGLYDSLTLERFGSLFTIAR